MTAFDDAAAFLFGDSNFALDATFTPSGGAAETLSVESGTGVILTQTTERSDVFSTGFKRTGAVIADVPQAAVSARPTDGDTLVVGARTFTVRGAEPDEAGVIWTLDLDEQ